jgi:hypothetical protein
MDRDNGHLAEKLQRLPPNERAQAKEQFISRWRDELDELLRLLWSKDEDLARTKRIDPTSAEYHTIEILQLARYSSAADFFVRHIDVRSTAFPIISDEAQVHFQFFPFAVAVTAIGMPAVSALSTHLLEAEPGTTRFQLSCLVLKQILGEELAPYSLANLTKKDPELLSDEKKRQASRFLQMRVEDWEATFCSDYSTQ